MAKVYHPPKTTTKLAQGAIAGLLGGLAAIAVMFLVDVLTPERSWWTTPSSFGSIFTGAQNFNTVTPDPAPLLLGLVVQLAMFALLGMGFINYLRLFTRFGINPILGGALYGALMFVAVLFFLWAVAAAVLARHYTITSYIALLVAFVVAGAVIGWWLERALRATSGVSETAPPDSAPPVL